MSDVVGPGTTRVTFLRTVGVPSLSSCVVDSCARWSSGPSRSLLFVILSPRSGTPEQDGGFSGLGRVVPQGRFGFVASGSG